QHPVPGLEAGDALAHRLDDAGDFTAGRERQLGNELVLLLDDQGVREIHPGGLDVDQDLAGARHGICDFLDHERLGRAPCLATYGFHAVSGCYEVVSDAARPGRPGDWLREPSSVAAPATRSATARGAQKNAAGLWPTAFPAPADPRGVACVEPISFLSV